MSTILKSFRVPPLFPPNQPSLFHLHEPTNHGNSAKLRTTAAYQTPLNNYTQDKMAQAYYEFEVAMSCGGCSGAVERVLKKLDGTPPPPTSLRDPGVTHTALSGICQLRNFPEAPHRFTSA